MGGGGGICGDVLCCPTMLILYYSCVQNLHGGSFWFPPQDPYDLNPT